MKNFIALFCLTSLLSATLAHAQGAPAMTFPASVEAESLTFGDIILGYDSMLLRLANSQLGFSIERREFGNMSIIFKQNTLATGNICLDNEDMQGFRTFLSKHSNSSVNLGIIKSVSNSPSCKGKYNLVTVEARMLPVTETPPPKEAIFQKQALLICLKVADLGYQSDVAAMKDCVSYVETKKFNPSRLNQCEGDTNDYEYLKRCFDNAEIH